MRALALVFALAILAASLGGLIVLDGCQPSCSEQCAAAHATRIEAEGCVCIRIIEPPSRSCEEAWEKVDWAMNQLGLCKAEMMTRCGP